MVHEIPAHNLGIRGRLRLGLPNLAVALVSTNKHFWRRCWGRHRSKLNRQGYEQNQNWYLVAKQANLALFSL